MRFVPSRQYLSAGLVALALATVSGWCAFEWTPAAIPAVLLLLSSALLMFLALRPPIEIHEKHLAIGNRMVLWVEIRRVDRSGWVSPLVVHLSLEGGRRALLIYPGDLESANTLLRQLRRRSREALIDGVPYRQFWGEVVHNERRAQAAVKYPLLRPEDEAEVERLYQRLKTVGHIDPRNSSDES
jgi:hypothetical protein